MVLKRDRVEMYLRELQQIVANLEKHQDITPDKLGVLDTRWVVERGLIAAAQIVFDVADHILASDFSTYPPKYEDSISQLTDKQVIGRTTGETLRGLGGFRNILVHEYVMAEMKKLHENFLRFLPGFRSFIADILTYIGRPS